MSVATFEDADLTDEAQLHALLLAEEMDHRVMMQAALGLGYTPSLYPTSPDNLQEFLHFNQRMHQELSDLIGLGTGPDLEEWDLSDPNQAAQWLQIEIEDHNRLARAYGVR